MSKPDFDAFATAARYFRLKLALRMQDPTTGKCERQAAFKSELKMGRVITVSVNQ